MPNFCKFASLSLPLVIQLSTNITTEKWYKFQEIQCWPVCVNVCQMSKINISKLSVNKVLKNLAVSFIFSFLLIGSWIAWFTFVLGLSKFTEICNLNGRGHIIMWITFSFVRFTYFRVPDGRRALVLVVFVGGVTFAEISALRFLSSQVCLLLLNRQAKRLTLGTWKIRALN